MTDANSRSVPGEGRRLLIVNADDFGLTDGVCAGILEAHRHGVVTSTSALAVGPAWARHRDALASSGIGVGAHLCAVGEDPPLLSAQEIPTLVDRNGRFPLTWTAFLRRSASGRVDTDDLRREFGAQLEELAGSGVRLTHLDSHQNLHLWPQVSGVLFELADRYGIGAARLTRTRSVAPSALGVRALGRRFGNRCRRAGLATPAATTGLDEAGRMSLSTLVASIDRLGASGATSAEVATHPGLADDPERSRYDWDYRWADEFEALCDPSTRAAVDRAGFVLGDFGDLVAHDQPGDGQAS